MEQYVIVGADGYLMDEDIWTPGELLVAATIVITRSTGLESPR
jgi:hypothetical protein